jgi:hypothetical protein
MCNFFISAFPGQVLCNMAAKLDIRRLLKPTICDNVVAELP